MSDVATIAKYADQAFADHIDRQASDSLARLARFDELDVLDQVVVVLGIARLAPGAFDVALRAVNDMPCWGAGSGCGHPRHVGACEDCGCQR